jgi:hypothetical protein
MIDMITPQQLSERSEHKKMIDLITTQNDPQLSLNGLMFTLEILKRMSRRAYISS